VNLNVELFQEFGSFCANGEKAAAFRFTRIEPFLDSHDRIILDFAGVHNVNSSFANALVANLISQHTAETAKKLHFVNCNARVRVSIEAAIAIGLQRLRERSEAPA